MPLFTLPSYLVDLSQSPFEKADDRGVALRNAASGLGVSVAELMDLAGLHVLSPSRSGISDREAARLDDMLRILARVSDWAGGPRKALAWYVAEPIPAFGGKTAQTLVNSGKMNSLCDYLEHIALGGFA